MAHPNALPDLVVNVDTNRRVVELRQKADRFSIHEQVIQVPFAAIKKVAGALLGMEADWESAGLVMWPVMSQAAPSDAAHAGGLPAVGS